VSEEHHFAAIEYPLNLFESAAFTETLERGKTLQQLANQFNLMHFPYRTINAAMPTVELFQEYLKKNNLSVTPPSRLVPMQFRLADVIDEPTTPDITQRVCLHSHQRDTCIWYLFVFAALLIYPLLQR